VHPSLEGARLTGAGEVTLNVRDGASLSAALRAAGEALDVVAVHTERPSLHDIYVRAVGAGAGPKGERA
jgi:hypothetical protein